MCLQKRLPRHAPSTLGRRINPVVVQDPLHRGPGELVPEVRERAADPRVAPPRILDGHPDHERGDVSSRHRPASTAAGATVVFPGDQFPVPAKDRVRGDDAGHLRQDPPAEFLAAHGESTALGVGQVKRPRTQLFPKDPILLPEIVDQIVLVAVHPTSEREDEKLQRRGHGLRLLGRLGQHRPDLGVGGNCKFPICGNRKPHTLVVGGLCPAFHDVGESNSEGAGHRCMDGRRGCC